MWALADAIYFTFVLSALGDIESTRNAYIKLTELYCIAQSCCVFDIL